MAYGAGNLNDMQLRNVMAQGALAERISQERALDAASVQQGSGLIGGLQQVTQIESALRQGLITEQSARERIEALLRQGALGERAPARESVCMQQSGVFGRQEVEHNMQRNGSQGNLSASSTGLADVVMAQMRGATDQRSSASSCAAADFNRPTTLIGAEQTRQSAEQMKTQMLELYKELERLTTNLQETQQENNKLKEDKEACETAHARDVQMLEGMLQQIGAENERLTKTLAKVEEQVQQSTGSRLPHMMKACGGSVSPSAAASIRSASQEPAVEPEVDQADVDNTFRVGCGGYR